LRFVPVIRPVIEAETLGRGQKKEKSMKVKDAMTGTAYYCQLDTNLGSAMELMWLGTADSFLSWDQTARSPG
jgi:hypothetical protein